jgi:hypothetical protein
VSAQASPRDLKLAPASAMTVRVLSRCARGDLRSDCLSKLRTISLCDPGRDSAPLQRQPLDNFEARSCVHRLNTITDSSPPTESHIRFEKYGPRPRGSHRGMGVEIGAGLSGGEPAPILYGPRLQRCKIFVNQRILVNRSCCTAILLS